MAYRSEKETGDIVIDGWEKGTAPSPLQGIANLQGVNIQTEMGEVMCSYNRAQQSQVGDTVTSLTAIQLSSSILSSSSPIINGSWITVTNAGTTGISNGDYYIQNSNGVAPIGSATEFQISSTYNGSVSSGFSAGTITFNLKRIMSTPVQAATEQYLSSNVTQYRYYILDIQGLVWVYDTGVVNTPVVGLLHWFLPDPSILAPNNNAGGIAVMQGYVHVFVENTIYVKESVLLGVHSLGSVGWDTMTQGLNTGIGSTNSHYAVVTQNNTLTYCDGAFVGTIQSASNSGSAATAPIWSYGQYTFSGTNLYIGSLFGGGLPLVGSTITFTTTGTLPTGVSANTRYYVTGVTLNTNPITITISAKVGGVSISLADGSGIQYFNTYDPVVSSTYIFSPQALSLPFSAVAKTICEIGNTLVIGTQSNVLYFWDEYSPLPSGFIPLPENNVQWMINVNNMAYMGVGYKGNIYLTNGNTASAAISVPDYCAGIPGNPTSYIEPYFVWGGATYIRGRVYFSIQDQTASKAGNCGGIWSFLPTQNLFAGQDVGLSLRLEAQNSYGSYNGVANVIIPSQTQNAIGAQYWSAWTSSVSSPTYGIDFSDTVPVSTFSGGSGTTPFSGITVIESDAIPVGTLLNKKSFSQVEYKLSTPLVSGEAVGINYRGNMTDAWLPLTLTQQETGNPLSGVFTPSNGMQNLQWVQLQVVLSSTTSNPSFTRLKELRLR